MVKTFWVLTLFFYFWANAQAESPVITDNGEVNCNIVQTATFSGGWSLKHYTLSYGLVTNVWRTELYFNGELKEYQDTVFYSNGGVMWWYNWAPCLIHSELSNVSMDNGLIELSYNSFNPMSNSVVTRDSYDVHKTYFQTNKKSISDIWVWVYAFWYGTHFYVKLNLKDANTSTGSNIASQGFFENIIDLWWASAGSKLSSSRRYGVSGCTINSVNNTADSYEVHYTCNVYHYKSRSAIGWSEKTTYASKTGVFVLPREDYDLCSYEYSFCISLSTNYLNSLENNSFVYTSQNTASGLGILEQTVLQSNNIENNQTASQDIQTSSDAWDPVRLETGAFSYDNTLMRVPSTGMDFSFDVFYKNQAYYNGPIWNNFDFSYNKYLREDIDGNMYFHNGRLGVYKFEKQTDGTFAYNTNLDALLSQSGASYQLLKNGKTSYLFWENKKLSSIEDQYHNMMQFSYNENDELISIFDTQWREYTLSYYEHSRVSTLTDFNGNAVHFEYYSDAEQTGWEYDLKNIILSQGGEEKNISFEYTLSDVFEDAHNITKLIDAKGQTYVENTYLDDRVTTQKYGNGTISYTYTLSGASVAANQVTDRNGNITNYVFDSFGNTLSKTKDGETYSYEYNSDGKLIKEILPAWNGYSYSYDIHGNLLEKRQKQDALAVDSSDDIVTSYEYDLLFNIPTKIILPNGLETSYTLDTSGNIISSISSAIDSGNGAVIQTQSFDYDLLGQLISSTDTYGLTTTYNYSGGLLTSQTRAWIQTESYSYDAYGNILTKTDALGNITSYSYDAFYNRVSETSPEWITTSYAYDPNNNKLSTSIILGLDTATTQTSYTVLDTPSQITQEISEWNTALTQMSYDGNENIIETIFPNGAKKQWTYDSYDRVLTEKTIADGEVSQTSYSYDVNGNIISESIDGKTTLRSYDLFDRLILVTDAQGNTSEYSYDSMGNIIESIQKDAAGNILSHKLNSYNELNLPLTLTKKAGAQSRQENRVYDAAGNILSQTDAAGNITSYSYDTLMRQTQKTDANGLVSQIEYDLWGRVVSESIVSSAHTLTTTYSYDADGRLLSQTDNDGNTTTYSYNALGQITQQSDASNIHTNYSYDYRGKLLSESREGKTISYHYDSMGNMTQLIDANGNITQYIYNQKWNKTQQIYNDNSVYTFTYDSEWKLISESEPNGNTRSYIYDSLDRLTTKNITSTGTVVWVRQENYSYDGLGRLVSANNDVWVDIEFSYNLYGELISESQQTALGWLQTVVYDYDVLGNTTGIIYPSGSLLEQSYDNSSRLTGLVFAGEQILDIQYDTLFKTSQTYGNSRTTNYSYDTLGRLASLGSKSYSYDTLGNMLSDGDDSYEYDTLNRLESMTYGSTPWENYTGRSYEYDLMWNRSKENLYYTNSKGKLKNRPVLYDTNSLNQSTYRAYEKDIKKDFGSVTDWESRDGLAQSRGKQEYDASGNLIRKVVNADWSYIYHYDGNNRLIRVEQELYMLEMIIMCDYQEVSHKSITGHGEQ